jgi:hypothetical protein
LQRIALPLVLCNDNEIEPYLTAKRKLEEDFASREVEVGAFFFQTDKSLRPDNVRRTITNSERVRTIATQRSFVAGFVFKNEDGLGQMWAPLDVAYALKNRKASIWLDFHLGVRALNSGEVANIVRGRKAMLSWMIQNLGEMADAAKECGMGLLMESTPPLTMEEADGERAATAYAFATLPDLKDIRSEVGRSNLGITFDIAALGSVRAAQHLEPSLRKLSAHVNGFKSWSDLSAAYGTVDEWISVANEFHISNATGIGTHITDQSFRRKYGMMGTIEGAVTREEFQQVLRAAEEREAVCCVEVELDLKNLTYNEVHDFIEWVYKQ